jgi:hypothetical protein
MQTDQAAVSPPLVQHAVLTVLEATTANIILPIARRAAQRECIVGAVPAAPQARRLTKNSDSDPAPRFKPRSARLSGQVADHTARAGG